VEKMCGISIFKNISERDLYEELQEIWTLMEHRGTDGYGLLIVKDDGEVKILKALKKEELLEELDNEYRDEEFKYVIAHNRKASLGSITVNLTHPIKVGNVIVVHNGTKRSVLELYPGVESDTEAIARILNDRYEDSVRRHINEWLVGSGVVIGYDTDKNRWLFWKDSTRPLVQMVSSGYYFSEPVILGESYRFIENTESLVESKDLRGLFKEGMKFHMEDELYPGYCSVCKRIMLLVDLDTETGDICWECKILRGEELQS